MGSFGERLRREREMRGITLEEIAEATKISSRSLRALEQEQFDRLPGGIFNKGFVRAYARFLGIDEEQAVADYLAVNADQELPLPEAKAAAEAVADNGSGTESSGAASPSWRAIGAIVLLTALAAGGWYAYNRWRAQRAAAAANIERVVTVPAPAPAAAATTVPAATTPPASTRPTSTSAATPVQVQAAAAKPAEAKPAAILLRVRAVADSWMEIRADDKLVMSGVLPVDVERVVRADKRVVLDIGNAGGVEITHNGKPLPSLGPEGKHRVLTITPEGIQQ